MEDDEVQLLPLTGGGEGGGAAARAEGEQSHDADDAGEADESEEELAASSSSYDRATADVAPLPLYKLVALNSVWMWFEMYWFVLLIVAIPSQVTRLVSQDEKGYAMFVIFMVGGILNLLSSIFMGYLADRTYAPHGRRYTWLIASTVLLAPVTIAMASSNSLALITVLYGLISVVSTGISVAFNGLIADVVCKAQRGRASAIMGAMGVAGYILGAVLGLGYSAIGDYGMYSILSGLSLIAVGINFALVREPKFTREDLARLRLQDADARARSLKARAPGLRGSIVFAMRWTHVTILLPLFNPLLTNRDFLWVFLTRFFMQLGQYTVQEFLQYWLDDCIALPDFDGAPLDAETAVSLFMLPMLVTAAVSALVSGYLSDRWGRRRRIFIYISGLAMVSVCVALIFTRNLWLGVSAGVVFGMGLGIYTAVDFSIVLDVLPSKDDVARDVSLWHLALVLPQIFATPVAGLLLDAFQDIGNSNGIECLGYTVIWAVAAVYFCLGSALIRLVRGIR